MIDITIVATTWLPPGQEINRWHAFLKSYVSWQENLKFDGKIHLHVSDDGTEPEKWKYLQDAVYWDRGNLTFSRQQRHGVGASLNTGLKQAFEASPVVLHAVDDWELLQPLDLNEWVKFIEDPQYRISLLRFFPHPDLTGEIKFVPPYGWAMKLDMHHFVFSFRPALWHKRMFDYIGYFNEDVSALSTEYTYNQKLTISRENVWMALPELWRHIGEESLADVVPA